MLLFTIAFIFGGFYVISRLNGPLTLGGTSISPSSLYAGYAGASLILLLFSGATGAVFWIIGKLDSEIGLNGVVYCIMSVCLYNI